MRILVVDDEAEVLEMIRTMLDLEGSDTLVASSGKECMQIIKNEPEIDILITDIIMPDKEGLEII